MTITDIDKQFDEKFVCRPESALSEENRWVLSHLATRKNLKEFIHQIYSQAKAEQREEVYKKALDDMFLDIAKLAEPDERQISAGDLHTNMDIIHEIRQKLIQSLREERE